MNRYITALMAAIFLLTASPTAFSQRPEGLEENMLLSAVNEYNEGRYDAAQAFLSNIIEQNNGNDAAWYYRL